MKFRLIFLFAAALALASCGSSSGEAHSHNGETHSHEETATSTETHTGGKEYSSAYICPMHCEGSGSSQPGTCPVCGMDYVVKVEHIKDGHSHE